MRIISKFFFTLLILNYSGIACASFIGKVMEAHRYVPPNILSSGGTFSSKTFTVSDAVEVPLFGSLNESIIDISSHNILIDFWRPGYGYFTSGYYVFQDINSTIKDITGVTINAGSTTAFYDSSNTQEIQFDQSRISFDVNTISINFAGLGTRSSSQLYLDVNFSTVPVPAAAWLFGSGLLGLIGMARRKKSV